MEMAVDVTALVDEGLDNNAYVDLVWAALTIGFERLGGMLDGGIEGWEASGPPVAATVALLAGGPDELADAGHRLEAVA
jgi:hypothetical protein